MFSYDSYTSLLTRQHGEISPINWSKNSELARIQDYLVERVELVQDSTDNEESIIRSICDQLEGIMNNPDNVAITSLLDKIANDLSGAIAGAYNTIRTSIRDNVGVLSEEMTKEYNKALVEAGAEILVSENTRPSIDFNILSWGDLKNTAYVNEIKEAMIALNIQNPIPNKNNVAYAINKLPIAGFTNLSFEQTVYDNLLNTLSSIMVAYDIEQLKEAFNIFISDRSYNALVYFIKNRPVLPVELCNKIKVYKQMVKALEFMPMDISVESKGILQSNINIIKTTIYICEFILLADRAFWTDKLIITKDLINDDELKKYQDTGGTLDDIAYHIRAMYGSEVPLNGVETNTVLEFKSRVDEIITSKNTSIKAQMRVIKLKAMLRAIHETFNNYLRSIPEESIPNNMTKDGFYKDNYPIIKSIQDNFNIDKDNFEDACYKFIIRVWYHKSLVDVLFTYLGKAYVKLADQGVTDDVQQTALADVFVISTILAEYFAKQHIE